MRFAFANYKLQRSPAIGLSNDNKGEINKQDTSEKQSGENFARKNFFISSLKIENGRRKVTTPTVSILFANFLFWASNVASILSKRL